ncbi:MAG TPA: molybdopterin-dependent oxidoreductase [Deltaproteobacteria bacterium]|nr:molybdopterin-dependent oxidoreductase [Deltaproteobacteria bacterium]
MSDLRLWINNREVSAKSNQTIMEVADEAGITIPRLCYHPSLKPSGSCRLCAVEIDGYRGLPAACSTPVSDGMRVNTATPKVLEFRREILRLILQEHPRECLGCPRNGTCELQQLVSSVGIDFPYLVPTVARPPAKPGGNYFERDYSLCVHCGRCVRICHEVRGAKALVFREIHGRQEVSTPFDRPLEEVGCQFCGACVDVCPVGALREKIEPYQGKMRRQVMQVCEHLANIVMDLYRKEMALNRRSSLCPICGAGCRMVFELSESEDIIQAKPHPKGPANRGQACVQGRFLLKKYLQSPDRLKTPLVVENGIFSEKTWEEALDLVAGKFQSFGPDEVAVLTDARVTNEELYLLQKFARGVLKTNAIGCLTPAGHMATAEVLRKHFGIMAATNSLKDLNQAGCAFAIGLNPSASHPISGTYLRDATLNGTKLVVASPCVTGIARYADINLHYYPGTELTLISGILRVLLDDNHVDSDFAKRYPSQLEALRNSLNGYDLEEVARTTGVSHEALLEATCIMGEAPTLNILYGLGVAESPHVSEITEALVALSHIKGSLGKPGGGIAPLYGSGNFQGAWDMGMVYHLLPGQVEHVDASAPKALFDELASGKIKTLYLVLENLENNSLKYLEPYLNTLDFVVVQDVLPPNIRADVVLPMASVLEKEGTLTNSERMVQSVQPVLSPLGQAKSVRWVLVELARRMGHPDFRYENAAAVLSEIQKQVPAYRGVTLGGKSVQWPCPEKDHPGTPVLFTDAQPRWVPWKSGPPGAPEETVDKEFPFAIITKERLRPFFAGPLLAQESLVPLNTNGAIEMNPADAFSMGFRPGDTIRVVTRSWRCEGQLSMSHLLPPKMVAVPVKIVEAALGARDADGSIFAARIETQK